MIESDKFNEPYCPPVSLYGVPPVIFACDIFISEGLPLIELFGPTVTLLKTIGSLNVPKASSLPNTSKDPFSIATPGSMVSLTP